MRPRQKAECHLMCPSEQGGASSGDDQNVPGDDNASISAIIWYLNHRSFGADGDFTGNAGFGGDNIGPPGSNDPPQDEASPGQIAQLAPESGDRRDGGSWPDHYGGTDARTGSLFAFVGMDVDVYSGLPLGTENFDPWTGQPTSDPFGEGDRPAFARSSGPLSAMRGTRLLSSPYLLAENDEFIRGSVRTPSRPAMYSSDANMPVFRLNLTEQQLHDLEQNEKVFAQTEKAFEEDANRRARANRAARESATSAVQGPATSSARSQSAWGELHYQSTGVGFYRAPTPGDIIETIAVNDTGNTVLNIPVNLYLTLSNIVAAAINTVGNLEHLAEDSAKAVGFSETDIQAAKDKALIGEMGSLVSGLRAARIANAEVFGSFLNTPNLARAEAVAALPQAENWQSRLPGVQLAQSDEWWVKRVNPDANPLMRWWGESSIKAQSEGLDRLGGLATPHIYANGKLYTQDVGPTLPGSFRLLSPLSQRIYIQGSVQMGTFFNDIQPRNMGSNGVVFDPATDPVTKSLFWGGLLGISASFGYAIGWTNR